MKVVLLIWVIAMAVLMIVGWAMVWEDKEKDLRNRRGAKLVAVANGMMALYFLIELIFPDLIQH